MTREEIIAKYREFLADTKGQGDPLVFLVALDEDTWMSTEEHLTAITLKTQVDLLMRMQEAGMLAEGWEYGVRIPKGGFICFGPDRIDAEEVAAEKGLALVRRAMVRDWEEVPASPENFPAGKGAE